MKPARIPNCFQWPDDTKTIDLLSLIKSFILMSSVHFPKKNDFYYYYLFSYLLVGLAHCWHYLPSLIAWAVGCGCCYCCCCCHYIATRLGDNLNCFNFMHSFQLHVKCGIEWNWMELKYSEVKWSIVKWSEVKWSKVK